jgi:hypothetical protein
MDRIKGKRQPKRLRMDVFRHVCMLQSNPL